MRVIRPVDVRTRSQPLPVHEGWTGPAAPWAENGGPRGSEEIFVVVSLWYHFAPVRRNLMDRRKSRSAWYLRSPAVSDSGVARVAVRAVAILGQRQAVAGEVSASSSALVSRAGPSEGVPVVLVA